MIRYVFRGEIAPIKNAKKADPQRIGEAIQTIADKNGGRLKAEAVEEAARPKSHPLHQFFEWDDSIAARAYRIDQARGLIRLIHVEDDDYVDPPRAFLSVNEGGGVHYTALQNVKESAHLQSVILKSAKRDLEAFENRYRALEDICSDVAVARRKIDARISREHGADLAR